MGEGKEERSRGKWQFVLYVGKLNPNKFRRSKWQFAL